MNPDFWLQLIIGVAAAAGVYAAIKADLTRAILTAERAQIDATDAHHRLNLHLENHPDRRVAQ